MTALLIWTDGGARGNPGPAGAGVVVRDADYKLLAELKSYLGNTTNNLAEYKALVLGLQYGVRHGADKVTVHCDSELMVRQVRGIYKVRNAGIRPLHAEVMKLAGKFDHFTIKHIPREENCEADALVNQAIDSALR